MDQLYETKGDNTESGNHGESGVYPYAEMVFREFKDEYSVEKEREEKIEGKAATFISLTMAILGLYVPSIPFEGLRGFYLNEDKPHGVIVTILLIVLVLGFAFLIISFVILHRVYGIKGYPRVRLDDIWRIANRESALTEKSKSEYYLDLVNHYYQILCGWKEENDENKDGENAPGSRKLLRNVHKKEKEEKKPGSRDINNDKAEMARNGMLFVIVSFALITISTIGLRIIIGKVN